MTREQAVKNLEALAYTYAAAALAVRDGNDVTELLALAHKMAANINGHPKAMRGETPVPGAAR